MKRTTRDDGALASDLGRCVICNEFGTTLILAGGYSTNFCLNHRGEFHLYADETEERGASLKAEVALQAAMQRGDDREATDALVDEAKAADKAMTARWIAWIKERKEAFQQSKEQP